MLAGQRLLATHTHTHTYTLTYKTEWHACKEHLIYYEPCATNTLQSLTVYLSTHKTIPSTGSLMTHLLITKPVSSHPSLFLHTCIFPLWSCHRLFSCQIGIQDHFSVCHVLWFAALEFKFKFCNGIQCVCHYNDFIIFLRPPWSARTSRGERSTRPTRASRPPIASWCPHPRTRPQ